MTPGQVCPPTDGHRETALRISRALGAGALLVVGGVHLQQYAIAHFSLIPTIGPLFLLDFIAATSLGLLLLIPIRASARRGPLLVHSMAALAGIAVAAGALAALLISEHTPLFGFMEHGYRLEIVIAIAAEVAAVVSLGVFLAIAASWDRDFAHKVIAPHGAGDSRRGTTTSEA